MNFEEAHKAVRQAAIAAFISAGITMIIILLAMQSKAGDMNFFSDPLNLIDVVLIVICGLGLLKYSRAAAIVLFIYFIIAKIYLAIELGRPSGIGVALIFLYFFWKGIQGSFSYHKLRREEDPAYKPAPRWMYFVGIPLSLIFLVIAGFGLLIEAGVFPDTAVVDANKIRLKDLDLLVTEGILKEEEKVELFYSAGLTSIIEDGNILTDRRVISYELVDGELLIYSAKFAEIANIVIIQEGDYLNDTIIEIWKLDNNGFRLFLSAESDGDKRFIDEIKRKVDLTSNKKSHPSTESAG